VSGCKVPALRTLPHALHRYLIKRRANVAKRRYGAVPARKGSEAERFIVWFFTHSIVSLETPARMQMLEWMERLALSNRVRKKHHAVVGFARQVQGAGVRGNPSA
jgi:hypothetical protein